MRIIAVILTFIGFVLCFGGSLGVQFLLRRTIEMLINAETAGIVTLARSFDHINIVSYVTIVGCVFVFLGIVANIISFFTGKKQQAI